MTVKKSYYSIIDIGSNSIRLVIYAQDHSLRLHEVENVKAMARLRNYLTEDNVMNNKGIEKLIRTLTSFREVVHNYELTEFICVATAAVRQAKNQAEICEQVYEATGWKLRILSEKEEAYYGYLSVVNSTTINEGITIDIGGGSTEITYFKDRRIVHAHSFPFGALTLKQFFNSAKPTRKEIHELQKFLRSQLKTLNWIKGKAVPLIAIGGSARNLVQVHQQLVKYPLAGLHQYLMTDKAIEKVCRYLANFNESGLEKIEGLSKERADTIVPASFVFLTIYQFMKAKGFILSRKGLRDGVFYEHLAANADENLYPDVLKDSILELVYEYNLNREQIQHIAMLSKKLLEGLAEQQVGELTSSDWKYLQLGCYVYNLGNYIDSESSSQHSFYLLANRTIDGLLHIERLKLALLASFKNKTVFQQYMQSFTDWLSDKEQEKLYTLGALLKFMYCLDATKRQVVTDFDLKITKRDIYLDVYCNQDFMPEQYQAEKQKKHLEKALDRNVHINFTIPVLKS